MTTSMEDAVELFSALPDIEKRIESASGIGLFLDFDGTISPIVPVPADAELLPEIRPTLLKLVQRPDFTVGIVTGRSLDDVKNRVNVPNLFFVGNHGLEIETKGEYRRNTEAEVLRGELRCLSLQLQLALSGISGVEIEDKAVSLSVHFRRADDAMHSWIARTVLELVERAPVFVTKPGKLVVEVRPKLAVNKGTAVTSLVRELLPASALLIYIGDDISDEDAFAAIPAGINIRVGDAPDTHAQYVVADVPEVARFLDWLAGTKAHGLLAASRRAGQ